MATTDRNTSIRATQLRNFSITAADLANNSITGDKLVDATISGSKLANNIIAMQHLNTSNAVFDASYLKYTVASGLLWAGSTAGSSDHSELFNLDYDSSGHTGFVSITKLTTTSGDIISQIPDTSNFLTATEITTISGDIVSQISTVSYASNAETASGTEDSKSVTPASLASINQYDYIWIPAGAITPHGDATYTAPVAETIDFSSINKPSIDVVTFPVDVNSYAKFTIVMPYQWDRSSVKFKIYWSPEAGTTTGNCLWYMRGERFVDNGTLNVALQTGWSASFDAFQTAEKLHIGPSSAALTVYGSPAVGDLILFDILRNGANASDTLDGGAHLVGVQIQYKKTNTVSGW